MEGTRRLDGEKRIQNAGESSNPDQQSFIAWGQFRGDEIRPEMQRLMIQRDPHPVAEFRVIGPLANLPAFAEAFGCPANAEMVRPPEKHCEVW